MGSILTQGFYDLLYHNSRDAVIFAAPNGRILAANPAACALFGRSEELLQMLDRTSLIDQSDPRLPVALEERMRTGIVRTELTAIRADQTHFPADFTSLIFSDMDGSQKTATIIRDLSEKKRLEQYLAQLAAIVKSSHDAIVAVDLNGIITSWNAAAEALTGFSAAESIGQPGSSRVTVARRDHIALIIDQVKRGESIAPYDAQLPHKDGALRDVSITISPIRNELGVLIGIATIARDISDRIESDKAMREAQNQIHALIDQALIGIQVFQDGRIVYANALSARILGYATSDELLGGDPFRWVHESDRVMMIALMHSLVSGEIDSVSPDFRALRQDGTVIRIGSHGARGTYNGAPAVIALIQDISAQKTAEEAVAQHAKDLRKALMSTVAVITSMSEMRDPYTAGHERRVAELAAAIGAELGLDADKLECLRVAGFLHDIGKISLPAEILVKPSKLSAIEFSLVKSHSQAGYDILKDVEFPWPVADIARQHHERINGSGYPQGLKGNDILLEARIMAVADVIEAMSSHRPYRGALGIDQALAEIEMGRGTLYDEGVVDACLRLFRVRLYRLPV